MGYFVIYAATRAEAGVKRFGRYLGVWLFFLAAASVLAGGLASTVGMQGPMGGMMGGIGQHMQSMQNLQEEQLAILRELRRN